MDTNELKTDLQGFADKLKAFEERARKLVNQNLADIAASAHGKIKQLIDHPDTHLVADTHKDQTANPNQPFDPKAPATRDEAIRRAHDDGAVNPEAVARTNWPGLFVEQPTYGR